MSGGGHATLTEAFEFIGVPVTTGQGFVDADKRMVEWWWLLFEDIMKSAEKERTLLSGVGDTVQLKGHLTHGDRSAIYSYVLGIIRQCKSVG